MLSSWPSGPLVLCLSLIHPIQMFRSLQADWRLLQISLDSVICGAGILHSTWVNGTPDPRSYLRSVVNTTVWKAVLNNSGIGFWAETGSWLLRFRISSFSLTLSYFTNEELGSLLCRKIKITQLNEHGPSLNPGLSCPIVSAREQITFTECLPGSRNCARPLA